MAQAELSPTWVLRLSAAEIRLVSLALAGRIKPGTPEAAEAKTLLAHINRQRLSQLDDASTVLSGMQKELEGA